MFGGERAAQRHDNWIVLETLDRRDLRASAEHCIGEARARWLAVNQQRASPTYALFASQVGAGEMHPFAQEIGEMGARLDALGNLASIHPQLDRRHGTPAWSNARCRTTTCCRRATRSTMPA
jgi:hypothetical protein